MTSIDAIVRRINRDLSTEFEERLRSALADRDRDWLVDQIVRLTLDHDSLRAIDRRREQEAGGVARIERLERVRAMALDAAGLARFIEANRAITREALVADGHLAPDAPAKGTALIGPDDRPWAGETRLQHAKDVLFALLFGDEGTATRLERVQPRLLSLALPHGKATALDVVRSTPGGEAGGEPHDERAGTTLVEARFGETADRSVGAGIVTCLSVINNLELNEAVLFAHITDLGDTTLIE